MKSRLYRFLLDPAPTGAGGGGPAPSPEPPPAPPAPVAPPAPKGITLTPEDYQVLLGYKTRTAEYEAAEAKRQADIQAAHDAQLIEKGKWEEALTSTKTRLEKLVQEKDEKLSTTDKRFRTTLLNEKLAVALSGFNLVPGAVAQLTRLYRDEFEVVEAGDSFKVQTRTQEAVDAFLKAELAKPENEHWLKASGGPGTGGQGGGHRPGADPAPRPVPRNSGEKAIADWLATKNAGPTLGLGGFSG